MNYSGNAVEEVNQFTYLAGEICKNGGRDADEDCRVTKAKGAFVTLLPIWRNTSFSNSLKVHIFKNNVVSVLLHGTSTWKVTKSITTKLQVFANRCLRSILHIYWSNTISNVNRLKMAETQMGLDWVYPAKR